MSYFSSRSTWLGLVEFTSPYRYPMDERAGTSEDYTPCLPASKTPTLDSHSKDSNDSPEQLDTLKELRHRLVFYHNQWDFAAELLESNLKLARLQKDDQEALLHYCHARHIAKTLTERMAKTEFLPQWLEIDLIIAEIHQDLGNTESCRLYAQEGLDTIKRNKFPSILDLQITHMAIRFVELVGRQD